MIKFGRKLAHFAKSYPTLNEVIEGYYLVLEDGFRVWFSDIVDVDKLEEICDEYLNERNGYSYWIDYCHGVSVDGRLAWSNIDQTDLFI